MPAKKFDSNSISSESESESESEEEETEEDSDFQVNKVLTSSISSNKTNLRTTRQSITTSTTTTRTALPFKSNKNGGVTSDNKGDSTSTTSSSNKSSKTSLKRTRSGREVKRETVIEKKKPSTTTLSSPVKSQKLKPIQITTSSSRKKRDTSVASSSTSTSTSTSSSIKSESSNQSDKDFFKLIPLSEQLADQLDTLESNYTTTTNFDREEEEFSPLTSSIPSPSLEDSTLKNKELLASPFPSSINNLPMTLPIQSSPIPLHRQFTFIPSSTIKSLTPFSDDTPSTAPSTSTSTTTPHILIPVLAILKCNTCNLPTSVLPQVLTSLESKIILWTDLPPSSLLLNSTTTSNENSKKRNRKSFLEEEVEEEVSLSPLERSEMTEHRRMCTGIAKVGELLLPSTTSTTTTTSIISTSTTVTTTTLTTSTSSTSKSKSPKKVKPRKGYVTILLNPTSSSSSSSSLDPSLPSTSTSTSIIPSIQSTQIPVPEIPFGRPSPRKWYKSRREPLAPPVLMNTRKVISGGPLSAVIPSLKGKKGVALRSSALIKGVNREREREEVEREKREKGRRFIVTLYNSPTITPKAFHFGISPTPTPTEPYQKKCTFLHPYLITTRSLPLYPSLSYQRYSYVFPTPIQEGDKKGKIKVRLINSLEGEKDRSYQTDESLGGPGMEMILNRKGRGLVEWAWDSDDEDDDEGEEEDEGDREGEREG